VENSGHRGPYIKPNFKGDDILKKRAYMYCLAFFIVCGISQASITDLNDVITNYKKYTNRTFTVEGKIVSVVCRKHMNINIVDLSNPNDKSNDAKEYSLYYLSSGSDGLYIISFKHFDVEQKAKIKTKMLMTSEDEVNDKTELMFNKYILRKCGVALPSYDELKEFGAASSFNDIFLNDLISKLPTDEFWILLVDIE
jgi:hypothetical protein